MHFVCSDSMECCFHLFLFWNTEPAGKKVKMYGGSIEGSEFCPVFDTSAFATRPASKNEGKTPHAIHPSCYSVPCI